MFEQRSADFAVTKMLRASWNKVGLEKFIEERSKEGKARDLCKPALEAALDDLAARLKENRTG